MHACRDAPVIKLVDLAALLEQRGDVVRPACEDGLSFCRQSVKILNEIWRSMEKMY